MKRKLKDLILFAQVVLLFLLVTVWVIKWQKPPVTKLEQQVIEAEGKPVQVTTWVKVGDDVVPKQHATFCQMLPFKRRVGDDRIYCYTVVETK